MLLIYQVIIVVSTVRWDIKKALPILLPIGLIDFLQSFYFPYGIDVIINSITISHKVVAIGIVITFSFLIIIQIAYAFYYGVSSQIPFIFVYYITLQ